MSLKNVPFELTYLNLTSVTLHCAKKLTMFIEKERNMALFR